MFKVVRSDRNVFIVKNTSADDRKQFGTIRTVANSFVTNKEDNNYCFILILLIARCSTKFGTNHKSHIYYQVNNNNKIYNEELQLCL